MTILPFILLLLVLAVAVQNGPLFAAVWFLGALYVLSRLWVRRAARRLVVRRRFVDHAFSGERVEVELEVRNRGLLPVPWLELEESMPMNLRQAPFTPRVISLGGHTERHFRYTLDCRRRGSYQLGPLRIQTGDLLNLEQRVLAAPEPRRLTVYPEVVPLQRLGLPTQSALVAIPARQPLFEDPSRIIGVREYSPGDPLRRIHWTASARTGRLVVKQFQAAMSRDTMICLDLDPRNYELRQRYQATELAIVVAASLASHMILQERLPAGLTAEGVDSVAGEWRRMALPAGARRADLMKMLEALARVEAAPRPGTGRMGQRETAGTDPFVALLREVSVGLSWGSTLILVTGRVSDELAEAVLFLKRSGHAVALILVRPAVPQAAAPGVPVYRIWNIRDLAGVS